MRWLWISTAGFNIIAYELRSAHLITCSQSDWREEGNSLNVAVARRQWVDEMWG